ncbi:unnamed protein product [Penicillium glandicola]
MSADIEIVLASIALARVAPAQSIMASQCPNRYMTVSPIFPLISFLTSMSPKLRWFVPPDAVKGVLDALQRSFIRFLGEEVKTSGWVVGKIHHLYKERYERSLKPLPTRTWYAE